VSRFITVTLPSINLISQRNGPFLFIILIPILVSCASLSKKGIESEAEKDKPIITQETTQVGIASWYGIEEHGNPTATGERFSKYAFTAAHKSLPMGTIVRVTNLENGRDVIVKINDRGPFVEGRLIDLSHAAARSIGIVRNGTANVKIEVVTAPGRSSDFFVPIYTVQVGSFSSQENALAFKDRLSASYDDVRIETFKLEGEKYYRVRIGHFYRREQAERLSNKLNNHGYSCKVILE